MIKELHIPQFDMIMCLSKALDLVSTSVVNHHMRVAYIAYNISAEMGMDFQDQIDIILAGAIHDIGAFSLHERLGNLNFELHSPHHHSEIGYHLLKNFEPFSKIATLVRYHHLSWGHGTGAKYQGEKVPLASHIMHLADRVDVLIDKNGDVLNQVDMICEKIQKYRGEMFHSDVIDAFIQLARKESFWLDVTSPYLENLLSRRARLSAFELDLPGLVNLAKLFSKIIDFRSPFTATHSSGVAACAEGLASLAGLSRRESLMLRVAGYLHDLGKLAVPAEILEKPGRLSKEEFYVIKRHTYYTYRILETVPGLEEINNWASFHHERLDGNGYPFHHKNDDLSLGARIMAVADIFTAITEDRPYREGMKKDQALGILHKMANSKAIDMNIVTLLSEHYEEINLLRKEVQVAAAEEFKQFKKAI